MRTTRGSTPSVVAGTVDADPRLAEAIATGLYKLMAYKDEYEVARLSLDPALEASVRAQFGDGARYAWKLHPPVLRAVGMQRKITLGRWFRPGYRTLRAMRRLRGTRLDPFGVAEVRRVERELVAEYRSLIPTLLTLDGATTRRPTAPSRSPACRTWCGATSRSSSTTSPATAPGWPSCCPCENFRPIGAEAHMEKVIAGSTATGVARLFAM